MKEIYIDKGIAQSRVVLIEDNEIKDIYIENHDDKSISGNIYKGRIENVVPGLNAVFINIGIHQNAIMHIDESSLKNYKEGQDIIVQVIREPNGSKGARVGDKIAIPGKFMVLLPEEDGIHISKKINNIENRKILNDNFKNIIDDSAGIIVRTEALKASEEELHLEYNYLKKINNNLLSASQYIKAPKLIFDSKNFYEYVIREYVKYDIDRIVVNSYEGMENIKKLLEKMELGQSSKVFYNEYDFRYLNIISSGLNTILGHRIQLKSGGYLLIDHTDAFTCIDVNTGKFIGDNDLEETAKRINYEACSEIYNLVKLKNISGIVLIDFINMNKKENESLIKKKMEENFLQDKVNSTIHGFTKLGILEMSRAKKGKSLEEIIFEDRVQRKYNCAFLLKEIENECLIKLKHYNINNFRIYISIRLREYIDKLFPDFTKYMKKIFEIKIDFVQSLNIDDYYFDENKDKFVRIDMGNLKINGNLIEFKEENNEVILRIQKIK